MKTKDITKATEPGNHYDSVAIFRVQQSFGLKMVRLATAEERAAGYANDHWSNRNAGKTGFITVVEVEMVDMNGQTPTYNDFNFIATAFVDNNKARVTNDKRELAVETLPVSQIVCQLNDSESIVDWFNALTARREEEAQERKIRQARQERDKVAHEERAIEIRKRLETSFSLGHMGISPRYDRQNVEISSATLLELIKAAEAAKAAGLVK